MWGLAIFSREQIIHDHTRPLAQELFGNGMHNPAILVVDGTYVFSSKRATTSSSNVDPTANIKTDPLVKPMVTVSTTGYIVSVLGPYFADHKNNDASILKHNFHTNMENIKDSRMMVLLWIVGLGPQLVYGEFGHSGSDAGISSKRTKTTHS